MSRSGLCWCIEHEQCQDLCKLFTAEAINQCRGQVFAGASNMSSIRTCASYLQQRPSISVEVRSLPVHRT